MQKLPISPAVDKIIKAIGGIDWLRANAKPWSTGYSKSQFFFSPQQGGTYWLSVKGSTVAERRESQGLKGCIVTDQFQCPFENLRQAIEAKIHA